MNAHVLTYVLVVGLSCTALIAPLLDGLVAYLVVIALAALSWIGFVIGAMLFLIAFHTDEAAKKLSVYLLATVSYSGYLWLVAKYTKLQDRRYREAHPPPVKILSESSETGWRSRAA